jgi:hypothetical protein
MCTPFGVNELPQTTDHNDTLILHQELQYTVGDVSFVRNKGVADCSVSEAPDGWVTEYYHAE